MVAKCPGKLPDNVTPISLLPHSPKALNGTSRRKALALMGLIENAETRASASSSLRPRRHHRRLLPHMQRLSPMKLPTASTSISMACRTFEPIAGKKGTHFIVKQSDQMI